MADALSSGSVLLNNPVTSIAQKADKVLITTKKGKRFQAKKAILANIPSSYGRIEFQPALPADKQSLTVDSLPGIYAKMIVSYKSAWWREAGLSGNLFSYTGPITYGLEIAVPELEQYSLALFIAGDFASDWFALPDPEKESVVVEHLATMVGEELAEQARATIEIHYTEWTHEEYIAAGPTDALGPGALRKYGETLRQPFEHLHFASTETAYAWKGYLEGAVTAGYRAAEEVIAALRS
jgi:monoamine oxidase